MALQGSYPIKMSIWGNLVNFDGEAWLYNNSKEDYAAVEALIRAGFNALNIPLIGDEQNGLAGYMGRTFFNVNIRKLESMKDRPKDSLTFVFTVTDKKGEDPSNTIPGTAGQGRIIYINTRGRWKRDENGNLIKDSDKYKNLVGAVAHELGHALGGLVDLYFSKDGTTQNHETWNELASSGKYGETDSKVINGVTYYRYVPEKGEEEWLTLEEMNSRGLSIMLENGSTGLMNNNSTAVTYDFVQIILRYLGRKSFK